MIRGVNKQIIEINQIENGSFYKAILFVRPEQAGKTGAALEREAHTFLADTEADYRPPMGFLRKTERRRRRLFLGFAFLLAGVLITLFFLFR